MHDAFLRATMQFRLGRLQCVARGRLVTRCDGRLDLLHAGADPTEPVAIDYRAALGPANARLCRMMIGHACSRIRLGVAAAYRPASMGRQGANNWNSGAFPAPAPQSSDA